MSAADRLLLQKVFAAQKEQIQERDKLLNADYTVYLTYSSILRTCEVRLRLDDAESESEKQAILQSGPMMLSSSPEAVAIVDNFLKDSYFPEMAYWKEIRAYVLERWKS